jgi:hypothetical protein
VAKKITVQNERMIVNQLRINLKLSIPKIHSEMESVAGRSISQKTIRNVLRRYHFHGRKARKKPFISMVNRKKRLAFAKRHLDKPKEFCEEFWYKVIWSDTTRVNSTSMLPTGANWFGGR